MPARAGGRNSAKNRLKHFRLVGKARIAADGVEPSAGAARGGGTIPGAENEADNPGNGQKGAHREEGGGGDFLGGAAELAGEEETDPASDRGLDHGEEAGPNGIGWLESGHGALW